MEWTVVPRSEAVLDDFYKKAAGHRDDADLPDSQMPVLQPGVLSSSISDATPLDVWEALFPVGMAKALALINDELCKQSGRINPILEHELLKFTGLVLAGGYFGQSGEGLWTRSSFGVVPAPNFGQFGMSYRRFSSIRKVYSFCFSEPEARMTDDWWRFIGGIRGFNANRRRTIIRSAVLTIDESMSSWNPQTSKYGGLPNISFVKRKPKPLGTEFKDVCDGCHGVMLFLEIQEGKDRMREKTFRLELGGLAATAMRCSMGVISDFLLLLTVPG